MNAPGAAPRVKARPVVAMGVSCALGTGLEALDAAMRAGRSGLSDLPFETVTLPTWLGAVDGLDAPDPSLGRHDCRNNRLARRALQSDGFAERVAQAARRWGAHRVGVFVGTSTSGILQTEQAYRRRDPATGALPEDFQYGTTHNTYSVADYTRSALGLLGPAFAVSTACSSGAKVFASAARFIDAGLIDAAVVGGVDTLCLTTLYGFHSLELLSPDRCRPYDALRQGLSIGEAGAYALLERTPETEALAWLQGWGESSDGHHMSAPHPEGAGAALAMRGALDAAGLTPREIDYVNLHGTATPSNDAAEDRALTAVFGPGGVRCSSTKGATGHTLGAAGALEAVISVLALRGGYAPAGLHRTQPDPALHVRYLDQREDGPLQQVMSNSFGFGGSNACLIFGREDRS